MFTIDSFFEYLSVVFALAFLLYWLAYLPVFWYYFARPVLVDHPTATGFRMHFRDGVCFQVALWGLVVLFHELQRSDGWGQNLFGYVGFALPKAAILYGILLNCRLLDDLGGIFLKGKRTIGILLMIVAPLVVAALVVIREIRLEVVAGPFDGRYLAWEMFLITNLLISIWLLFRRSRQWLEDHAGPTRDRMVRRRLSLAAGVVALGSLGLPLCVPNF